MSQPLHVYGSSDGGQSPARRPIVLARIPHVGAQVGAVAKPAPVAHAAPVDDVESPPSAFSPGTRYYVDSQHTLAPPAGSELHEQPAEQSQPEPQSRHHRFHKAHGRRLHETSPADNSPPGVASGLSRLHGEVTSYSGLIVTLALAASGALLYWMIIAPGQAPIADYSNSYETFGSTEIEIPEFAPRTASSAELSAPPETTAEAAAELTHLPEQLPAPSDEPPPVFNDASAQVYPTTDHPYEWELARLKDPDIAKEEDVAGASPGPETLHPEMPPTPIRVSRQQ